MSMNRLVNHVFKLSLLFILCVPLTSLTQTKSTVENGTQQPIADTKVFIPIVAANNTPIPTPTPTITPTPTPTETPIPPAGNIVANHTIIPIFSTIPLATLHAAASIKTLFMHQSVGGNIDFNGLQCLAGLHNDPVDYPQECITYAQNPYDPYDDRQWNWKLWDTPLADAIAKTDEWVSVVNAQQQNYQVLGMKFCYVDGYNQDFNYYRTKMEQLEKAYPQKIFIWSTEVLWAKSELDSNSNLLPSASNIQDFNQQLRTYAIANHKVLYDLADIESHDLNGNSCQSNGYEALCDVYYTGIGSGGGGHPGIEGSIRLAKGFWWVMARISGWSGQ